MMDNNFDASDSLENSSHGCMKLYIDNEISINQFIVQIKRTFFKDIEEITEDDIWLYRIENNVLKSGTF